MTEPTHEVSWDDAKIARLWSYYASNRAVQSVYFSRLVGAQVLDGVRPWLSFERGAILDYGCGPGYLIEHLLARAQGPVYGLEFSAESAARADERLRGRRGYGGIEHARALPCAHAPGSMDIVTCIEVIEHLDDAHLAGALAEVRRLLKPGGKLVVTTPNEEDLDLSKTACPDCGGVFHRWQHVRSWTASQLRDVLSRAGFKVLACRGAFFDAAERSLYDRASTAVRRLLAVGPPPYQPHLFAIAEKPA